MKKNTYRTGIILRLAVITYDLLLLAGVLFASYAVIFSIFLLLPENIQESSITKNFQFLLLVFLAYLFYGWFWVKGGQTLGMKAWHLYLIDENGKFLTWKAAFIRFVVAIISTACLGMGFTWILVNRKKKTWHDLASKSQLIKYKPQKNQNNKP